MKIREYPMIALSRKTIKKWALFQEEEAFQISKTIFSPPKNCFSGLLGLQSAIHQNRLLDWVLELFTNTGNAAQATLQGCRDEVQVLHQAAKIILTKSKDR